MKESHQLKKTLLLPETSFPMRARLRETEPEILKKWESMKIHEKILENREGNSTYFLLDGPPYANGPIHLGHVVNKVLKDFVIKYKNMSGYKAPFLPVWDCHGLPIEMTALKKLKNDKKILKTGESEETLSNKEIRDCCRKEALLWMERQRAGFKRLGVAALWDQSVLTMDSFYEAEEIRALADIVDNGLLYRGKKPVFWCFKLETALAFSEAEYREHKSPSIYVCFDLTPESQKKFPGKNPISFVIWTTTPWTLPANSAICLHPDFEYGLYEGDTRSYFIAVERKDHFTKETGLVLSNPKITFKGRDLLGLEAHHPFIDRKSSIVLGEYVTLSSGTGCVHTAPGHGLEDYQTGQKFKLKAYCPVDEKGHFNQEAPEDLQGLFIFKGNKLIIEKLKASGHLLYSGTIQHTYPYNPRSDSPLIYRLTPQWFLKLDEGKESLRALALKASDSEIHFVPEWGKIRLQSMLKQTPDWCLSRQRAWGVPLVVFYCLNCSSTYLNSQTMREIAQKMEDSKQGIEYYFSTSVDKLLPKNTKCKTCGKTDFQKGTDILDVWFDSGIEHKIFRKNYPFPADLFLEGSDQHRGWFQTSLFSSLAIDKKVPFKTLLTHGFVNDSEGRKMSKSRGNGIDPLDVIEKNGAEILRLWIAGEDFSKDINAGNKSFERVVETYRRFRNTFRFFLGNLNGFYIENQDSFSSQTLFYVDRWILFKLYQIVKSSKVYYENFAFYKVYHMLNHFFTVDLSAFYLDIIKDRLYTFAEHSPERKAAQTVLFHLTNTLLPLMAPLATFLTEEVYTYFNKPNKKKSVLLENFPEADPAWEDTKTEALFSLLFPLREELLRNLEAMRKEDKIGSSLQARAVIKTSKSFPLSKRELCEFFGVSELNIEKGERATAKAFLADGEKCLRCWFYSSSLNNKHICPKCIKNIG